MRFEREYKYPDLDPEVVQNESFHHMFQLMEYEPDSGIEEVIANTMDKYPGADATKLRQRFIEKRGEASLAVQDMKTGIFEVNTPSVSDELEIFRGGNS